MRVISAQSLKKTSFLPPKSSSKVSLKEAKKLNNNESDANFLHNPIDFRSMSIPNAPAISDSQLDFSKPLADVIHISKPPQQNKNLPNVKFLLNEMAPPQEKPERHSVHKVTDFKRTTDTHWTPEAALGARSVEKTLLPSQDFKSTSKSLYRTFPDTLIKAPFVTNSVPNRSTSAFHRHQITSQHLTFG